MFALSLPPLPNGVEQRSTPLSNGVESIPLPAGVESSSTPLPTGVGHYVSAALGPPARGLTTGASTPKVLVSRELEHLARLL